MILTRFLLALALICATSTAVLAYPTGAQLSGVVDVVSDQPTTLYLDLKAEGDQFNGYTIGLYDLNRMTAAQDDPDYVYQALRADNAVVLHEAGDPMPGVMELTVAPTARLGVFILANATLREFSLGLRRVMPVFSEFGAAGSNLFEIETGLDYTTFIYETASPSIGMAYGVGPLPTDELRLTLAGYSQIIEEPVTEPIPEPATVAMLGLGLTIGGTMVRRRSKDLEA